MAADLTLAVFQPADLAAMQAVRQAAFAPVFQSFRDIVGATIAEIAFTAADEEQAGLLASLCAGDAAGRMLVARVDGAIVGFVSYSLNPETRMGEIGLNAVHPAAAGRGVGTAMYEAIIAKMKRAGMQVATVGTGGDPSHAPARRAYEKVGFGPALPSVYLYKLL